MVSSLAKKVMGPLSVLARYRKLDMPSKVALIAGTIAITYVPALILIRSLSPSLSPTDGIAWSTAQTKSSIMTSSHQTTLVTSGLKGVTKNLLTVASIGAFLVTLASAMQIQCMITGGCRNGAWFLAGGIVLTCILYIMYVDRIIKSGSSRDLSTIHPQIGASSTTSSGSTGGNFVSYLIAATTKENNSL
jgi:hypothetical protein